MWEGENLDSSKGTYDYYLIKCINTFFTVLAMILVCILLKLLVDGIVHCGVLSLKKVFLFSITSECKRNMFSLSLPLLAVVILLFLFQ